MQSTGGGSRFSGSQSTPAPVMRAINSQTGSLTELQSHGDA